MSKMVDRTLDFFEAFAEQQRPLLLTDLMKLLDISSSSCHDVLQALRQRGYLYETRPRGGFYPTGRLIEVARRFEAGDPFLSRVGPPLAKLRESVGESVFLLQIQGRMLRYLAVLDGDSPLRLTVQVGDTIRALHATSAGKALLGNLPQSELAAFIGKLALKPLTPNTMTDKAALERDVIAGEARGWFINREESIEDTLTVSTRFAQNGAAYVVTVAGSLKRMERKLSTTIPSLCALGASLAGLRGGKGKTR